MPSLTSFHRVMEWVTLAISLLGALVVITGVAEATVQFLKRKLTSKRLTISGEESIRHQLGAHLLLGLEIFIAADIISSFIAPTWDKVGILAVVVAIRTVLSYFLEREIRSTAEKA